MRKKIVAFDVAAEVERALLQHLENFFGQVGALHILAADRHQADRRILVTEHVARIDRAHDPVLEQMFGSRVAVRAGIDQDKNVRFGGKNGGDARADRFPAGCAV